METLEPTKTVVPLLISKSNDPFVEIIGTGFIIDDADNKKIITAKHVFDNIKLSPDEVFAFAFNHGQGLGIYRILGVKVSNDYDIACCDIQAKEDMVGLPFSNHLPALNDEILCYEYSYSKITKKPAGGKHVNFSPLTHKGNIMRYFDSDFPEKKLTPSFNTSFPAIRGASGAPVIVVDRVKKVFYVGGMMVANQEIHLLPAHVLTVEDGNDFKEETRYYLPLGKAINSALIVKQLELMGVKIRYID